MPSDLEWVDSYLAKWDAFAQGANALAPGLAAERPAFEAAMARLLAAGDPRAPGRLVFSAVVQVGGYVQVDSALGVAAAAVLGRKLHVTTNEDGRRVYFAGDLFEWWQQYRTRYEAYVLFDEWENREFTQDTVIPMYRMLASQRDE